MDAYITGIGIYSSLGHNVADVAASIAGGISGIVSSDDLMMAGFKSPLCGNVSDPDISVLPRRHRNLLTQAGRFAFVAAREALLNAGQSDILEGNTLRNIGLIVSNDVNAQSVVEVNRKMMASNDTASLLAHESCTTLNSNISIALARIFGLKGLQLTVSAACAGGLYSIFLADRLVRTGVLDGCLVVGAQEVGPVSWCAFDKLETGAIPSGGAAAVFIENELGYRGATIARRAKVCGFGCSTGNSPVTPSPIAERRAMETAINAAGISAKDIALVNAHLTGTKVGDSAELEAIAELFDEVDAKPSVWATKPLHGHELAMSGVSQVVETIALHGKTRVLINSFGFGGNNASMVLQTY